MFEGELNTFLDNEQKKDEFSKINWPELRDMFKWTILIYALSGRYGNFEDFCRAMLRFRNKIPLETTV